MPAATAFQNPQFVNDGQIGAALQQTFTISASDGYDNPPFVPGERRVGSNRDEWVYVFASATIGVNDCVAIDQFGNATPITNALATNPVVNVGVCQVVGGIPASSWGWVQTSGDAGSVNCLTGSALGAPMYTTATAGALSTTATSQVLISGISLTLANSSGSTAARACIMSSPRVIS